MGFNFFHFIGNFGDQGDDPERDDRRGVLGFLQGAGEGVVDSAVNVGRTVADLPVTAAKSAFNLARGDVEGAARAQQESYINQRYGSKFAGDTSGLGNAASFGLDVGTLGFGTGVKSLAKEAGKESAKELAKRAGKLAAEGAAIGGGYGVAEGLQENARTSEEFTEAIAKNAAIGGLTGGVIGGVPLAARGAKEGAAAAKRVNEQVGQGGYIGGSKALGFLDADAAGAVTPGIDNKPRFEVDDSAAKLNSQVLSGRERSLGEVLEHPYLYQDYPDLAGVKVRTSDDLGPRENGVFDRNENTIILNAKHDPKKQLDTLMHETQHVIQSIEGHAAGGSPEFLDAIAKSTSQSPFSAYRSLAGEAEARNVSRRQGMTQAEREATPFNTTHDVPLENQLVHQDEGIPVNASRTSPEAPTQPTERPESALEELSQKMVKGVPQSADKAVNLTDIPTGTTKGKIAAGAESVYAKLTKGDNLSDRMLKVRQTTTNRYAPIDEMTKKYEELTGTTLTPENDPGVRAALAAGAPDKIQARIDQLHEAVLGADPEAVKQLGVLRQMATDRSGVKNPLSPERISQAMAELEAKLGPEGIAKAEKAVQNVQKIQREMLDYAKDFLGDDVVERIAGKNPNYFTKFDAVDHLLDSQENIKAGSSFNHATQTALQAKKGGFEGNMGDPFESMIRQWGKIIAFNETNKVGQAIGRMATNLEKVDPEAGLTKEIVNDNIPQGYEKISFFRNGIKEEIAVPKDVADAMKNMNAKQADFITKVASIQTRILRTGATALNVAFTAPNAMRDIQTAMVTSTHQAAHEVIGNWLRGFGHAWKQDDLVRQFIDSGGGQSGFYGRESGNIEKAAARIGETTQQKVGRTIKSPVELVKLPFKALEKVASSAELATRLAEFEAAKKNGLSGEAAAYAGRNVSVDFNRAGTIGQIANQWVPFLNARLQGTVNVAKAIRRDPARAAAVISTTVVAPVVATYLWNRENFQDVYDQIPDYVKENSFVFIYGDEQDEKGNFTQVAKIPKGDVGKLFGNPLENLLDYAFQHNPKSLSQIAVDTGSTISPVSFSRDGQVDVGMAVAGVLPPAARGIVENTANFNFFRGAPVVSEELSKLPANEQVGPNSSPVAKGVGALTGQSPLKVDNFIQAVAGGLGGQIADPKKFVTAPTKSFTGASGNEVNNRFYSTLDKTQPLRASASKRINDAIKEGDMDKARDIADEYNTELREKFSNFKKNYGRLANDDLKEMYSKQKINLTRATIAQRAYAIKQQRKKLERQQNGV